MKSCVIVLVFFLFSAMIFAQNEPIETTTISPLQEKASITQYPSEIKANIFYSWLQTLPLDYQTYLAQYPVLTVSPYLATWFYNAKQDSYPIITCTNCKQNFTSQSFGVLLEFVAGKEMFSLSKNFDFINQIFTDFLTLLKAGNSASIEAFMIKTISDESEIFKHPCNYCNGTQWINP